MPFYDYRCDKCGATETKLCRIDKRNDLPLCVSCRSAMQRVVGPAQVNQGWDPEWTFPNLDPRPGVSTSTFETKADYEARLRETNSVELSLGIREV